ncbi:hypothetical protein OSG_eHP11_00045 [environmental Halophage eHP-11]|nr:hypothetical protein OSG_eHP11_00045 [environmental Halophage eHP-11]
MFSDITLDPAVVSIFGLAAAILGVAALPTARRRVVETTIRRLLARWVDTPTSEPIEESTIREAVHDHIDPSDVRIVTADGSYYATDRDGVESLARIGDALDWLPYRPDRFDCEEYAELLVAIAAFVGGVNACGVVYDWSGGHAYNVVVTTDGEAIFVESQTGEIVTVGEGSYALDDATIIF